MESRKAPFIFAHNPLYINNKVCRDVFPLTFVNKRKNFAFPLNFSRKSFAGSRKVATFALAFALKTGRAQR